MAYEEGMSIQYDNLANSVRITFRGQNHELPGPFRDRQTGIAAAEKWCRQKGWDG